MNACLGYDEELQRNGQMIGGETLQSAIRPPPSGIVTANCRLQMAHLRETKEFRGGIMPLEARDLTKPFSQMSRHPSLKMVAALNFGRVQN